MKQLTDSHAHTIATLAIDLDVADRELFKLEQSGAYRPARDVRARRDTLRAQLADAIADAATVSK